MDVRDRFASRFPLQGLTAVLAVLIIVGCQPPTTSEEEAPGPQLLELTDEDNCRFVVDLSAEVQPLHAGADILFSWVSLSRDVHGHPLDPEVDVDAAVLVAFKSMTSEEVASGLVMDTISQASVSLFANCVPQDSTCHLSDFGLAGNSWHLEEHFLEGSGTWLILLQGPGYPGGLAFLFLEPIVDGIQELAEIVDDSSFVSIDARLDEVSPVPVPRASDVEISWASLSEDGKGVPLDLYRLDLMTVSRYAGWTVEELQDRFIDLEALADETWELDIGGRTSANLSELQPVDDAAEPFPGVSSGSIWLMALRCTNCTNPTPKFLTVLEAASP